MATDCADTPRLRELLAGLTEDLLTRTEEEELTDLLNADDGVRAFYRNYMAIDAHLWWKCASPTVSPPIEVPTPVLGFVGEADHGTLGSIISSGWPVAYLVATVIFGIGLLVGAIVKVSDPAQVAAQLPPATENRAIPKLRVESVGRITGMVDCQWSDSTSEALPWRECAVGRKYALASGLMEITFATGAKVILQGPATYEVESAAGGFLSLGKLTAKVEKKGREERGERRGKDEQTGVAANQSEIINQKSPSPLFSLPSPLFTVRTPTAVVTDLGTEFGVEVSKDGRTNTHVFQGKILLVTHESKTVPSHKVELIAGESASVEVHGNVVQRAQQSRYC